MRHKEEQIWMWGDKQHEYTGVNRGWATARAGTDEGSGCSCGRCSVMRRLSLETAQRRSLSEVGVYGSIQELNLVFIFVTFPCPGWLNECWLVLLDCFFYAGIRPDTEVQIYINYFKVNASLFFTGKRWSGS